MSNFKRRWVGLTAGLGALALTVVGVALAAGVDPSSVSTTLASGASTTITKTVHTPAVPPKVDIVFLADTTGSMGSAIANVQSNAAAILGAVRTAQPDSHFGVASYKDVTDSVPFSLDQSITADTTAVQNAINTWSAGGGGDIPEAQLNALFQLGNTAAGFRADSTRVIAWFGDSSGHDPSNGHTLAEAIAALTGAHVTVLAIPVTTGSGDGLDASSQATAIASATGGQVLPSATPDQVSAAILSGLSNLPTTVTPSPVCDSGLTATYDNASQTVTSGQDAVFQETLTVAPNAPDGGTLTCKVDFLLNGNHVDGFQQSVAIDVPLRPTDLALAKSATPALVTEGNNVTYQLTATNNGDDPDANVTSTDTLPAGESFVSGDPGCSAVANVVTCDFGTLAAHATASKSIVVNVANGAASSLTNTASVTGQRPESNPGDNSATSTITVNHNPVCTALTAGPNLWPPNHALKTVTATGATDSDGDTLTTAITGVTQDEALNGLGDGDTSPDAALVAGHADQVQLRSERSGTADGRVYRLAVSVTDGRGGSCGGTITVGVPHDQGKGSTPIDSGLVVNSFGP